MLTSCFAALRGVSTCWLHFLLPCAVFSHAGFTFIGKTRWNRRKNQACRGKTTFKSTQSCVARVSPGIRIDYLFKYYGVWRNAIGRQRLEYEWHLFDNWWSMIIDGICRNTDGICWIIEGTCWKMNGTCWNMNAICSWHEPMAWKRYGNIYESNSDMSRWRVAGVSPASRTDPTIWQFLIGFYMAFFFWCVACGRGVTKCFCLAFISWDRQY